MEEKKHKGIFVDGVALDEYIKMKDESEGDIEIQQEHQEEVNEKRKYLRNALPLSRTKKYQPKLPDRGRKLSMSEVNREYLKNNLEGQKAVVGKVLAVLLTGKEWSAEEIYKEINEKTPNCFNGRMLRKQDVYAAVSRMKHSDFAPLLIKEKKPNDQSIYYRLHENCYEYSPANLYSVFDKRDRSMQVKDIVEVDLSSTIEEKPKSEELSRPKTEKLSDIIKTKITSELGLPNKIQIDVNIRFGFIKE